ncbi:hypothetical protein D3C84_921740 [compost metagenome]
MHHQQQGRARDEGRLDEARQRLRLAVAEAVLVIRRGQGIADGEQVDEGGADVHQGVGQRGEQTGRVRHQPGDQFAGDQQAGDGDRRHAGQGDPARILLLAQNRLSSGA